MGSGARPILYAAYRCLLNEGETVLTPAPSWNNKNFCQLVGAKHINVPTRAEDGFMPTADAFTAIHWRCPTAGAVFTHESGRNNDDTRGDG